MEYLVPAAMFVFGFGGALLVRRLVSAFGQRRGSEDLRVEKGAVRLDETGRKRRK